MKVVAYTRVSTNSEDQKNSIENQKKHYLELFQKHPEFEIADCGLLYFSDGRQEFLQGIYADEGITAKSTKKIRVAFQQMIQDAKDKKFDRIYIKNIARFSRYTKDGIGVYKELKKYGVEIIFEDGNLSTMNGSNEFLINMMISHAQEESRLKSIAVKYGMRESQKSGRMTMQRPYGYIVGDKRGDTKIYEPEAAIVKKIFDLYLNDGWGTGKIARWLNDNNILTKKSCKWSQKQITTILENEFYTGKIVQHKTETFDINEELNVEIPEDKWIIHYRPDLQIINKKTFELVQNQRKKRNIKYTQGHRYTTVHLLSGLIFCGNCGSVLKRKKRKAFTRKDGSQKELGYEWICQRNDMYGKDQCKYRMQIIEDDFIGQLKNDLEDWFSKDNEFLKESFDKYIQQRFNITNQEEEIVRLSEEKKKLQKQIRTNLELLSDNIITKEQYKEQNDELQKQFKQIESELNRFLHIEKEIERLKLEFEDYINEVTNLDFDNLTNATLRKILVRIETSCRDLIIEKIEAKKKEYLEKGFIIQGFDEAIEKIKKEYKDNKTLTYPKFRFMNTDEDIENILFSDI